MNPYDFRCWACRNARCSDCRWAEGCECGCPWINDRSKP